MRVVFSDEARADLVNIAQFIRQSGSGRGRSFVRELRLTCFGLATQSERFPIVVQSAGRDIRRVVHGRYLVLYTISRDVEIIRVLHSAQDWERLLPEG